MRRYLFVILFVAVLVTPFVLRLALKKHAPAERETMAGPRLVIITPHTQDIRREFEQAFSRWHRQRYGTSSQIVYLTPGGSSDIKRQLETTYRAWRDPAGQLKADVPADIDIIWGGGDFFINNEIKPLGIIQPLRLDAKLLAETFPQATLAGVKLYDYEPDKDGRPLPPQWVGVCLSGFGIVYNPDLYATLKLPAPQKWADLTDVRLANLVALADPTHSGSAAVAYLMVLQRAMADAEAEYFSQHGSKEHPDYQAAIARGWKKGMGQLLLIAANARYFTDSASQVPNDVGNGEAAAGMAIDFYGRMYQESVGAGRCRLVLPTAATAITPDPVAILYGVKGERLEWATRFVEFLLSREAQRLWILQPGQPGGPSARSLRRMPVRRDVYADRTGWADDVDPFAQAGGFNQRSEWGMLFSDTRPLWAAAWIDSRQCLKDAYGKILAVKDPQMRSELIAKLADLPIEMSDVVKLRAERKAMEQTGDVEQWKASQRIKWARKFREHYERVAIDK